VLCNNKEKNNSIIKNNSKQSKESDSLKNNLESKLFKKRKWRKESNKKED
jgi:hypothetical protein